MKSRKKAMEAKILIGNHHLLFTDARSRLIDQLSYDEESVLPPFQRLVIDEAHNIEKNATDFFTVTYSGHEMLRSIGRIAQKRRHAKGLVEELAPYAPDKNLPDDILQVIAQLVEAIGYVDTFLIGFMQQVRSFNFLVQVHMQAQLTDFIRLGQTLIGFTEILEDLVNKFLVKGVLPDELAHRGRELLVHVLRIRAGALALAQFINFEQWTEDVHWFEVNDYGKKGKGVAVHVSPLLVADSLKNSIFQGLATVVCTSATLDLNDNFAYWGSRIGLPLASDRLYLTAVHFSPFDFKKNLLLLTPNDAPIFSEKNSQDYITYVGKSVLEALLASGGGALVLFTSYKMLKEVSDALQSDLMKAGLTVLRQGDADRFQLLHQFTDDVDSVLFATDSFWEGVDAPGNTLRLVIIVKLPFRVPTDPVFRARQEALDKEGKSGFFTLALPEATMKLKQGFGRLLRNTVDTGIVLILDSRVVNKQYGRWMLQALPQSFHPETTSDGVPTKIESFLYG